MTDDLRAVLNQVAEGRIDPAAAARLLDGVPVDERSADSDAASRGTDSRVGGVDDVRPHAESDANRAGPANGGGAGSGDPGNGGGSASPGTPGGAGESDDFGNVRVRPPGEPESSGTVRRASASCR